ncbi:Gustatory and odorant receptor 24 [Frankliniella fusca]|uniref:Gustatory receptor n=1 Tax=Frankliniella fusca TaxID=407009 RepID=A0AAE1HRF8_9NEOP|nr:Gustatory and odorant receptor 24 [Frankliniella fusca]
MATYPSDFPAPAAAAGVRGAGSGPRDRGGGGAGGGRAERAGAEAAAPGVEDDVSYRCLRPVWLAMQAVGFYPMHRLCRGRRPREPSPWLALAALQYAAVAAGMVLAIAAVGERARAQGQGRDFDGVVIDYLVYMQCALPLAALPLYAAQRGATARYLRGWAELQAGFAREFGRPMSSCRGFEDARAAREVVAVVAVFSLLAAGAHLLLHPSVVVLALAHSTALAALLTGALHLHGRLLRAAARALADQLALVSAAGSAGLYPRVPAGHIELRRALPRAEAVDHVRLLVLRQVALAGALGEAVTLPLGLTMLLHFILATLTLYAVLGQLSYTDATRLPALGAGAVLSTGLLFLACDTGHRVSAAVKQLAVEELLVFHKRTTVIGQDLRKMVETFISSVQEVPSDVTLSGITSINRGLFTSVSMTVALEHVLKIRYGVDADVFQMLSTMVTYLVVIVQFRISLEQAEDGARGAGNGTAAVFSSTPLLANDSTVALTSASWAESSTLPAVYPATAGSNGTDVQRVIREIT